MSDSFIITDQIPVDMYDTGMQADPSGEEKSRYTGKFPEVILTDEGSYSIVTSDLERSIKLLKKHYPATVICIYSNDVEAPQVARDHGVFYMSKLWTAKYLKSL